jgi:hypothetical protein
MPTIKASELPNYDTPDSNDFVLILERSNTIPVTFKTYKTEVNSLLTSDVVSDAISEQVVEHLGSLNAIIGRLTYNTDKQQLILAVSNELLVNDVRANELDGNGNLLSGPDQYSVVPKKYVDNEVGKQKTYLEGLINNISQNNLTLTGGTLTGQLTLSATQVFDNERYAASVGYVHSHVVAQNFISANGATITGSLYVNTPTSGTMAANKAYVDNTVATGVTGITSDGIPEGVTNLYFTDARAQGAITVTGDLTYINGVISYTGLQLSDIPTKLSELTNDSGFIGTTGLADFPRRSEISAVGFSNNYSDLINKPAIPDLSTVVVSTSGGSTGIPIQNLVSAAGISGSFNDLANKPLGIYDSVEGLLQFVQTVNMKGDGLENIATTNLQGLSAIQVNVRPGTGINVSTTVYDNTDPANPVYVSGGEVSVDDTVIATKTYVDDRILTVDNTDEMAEGTTNLYYTDARVDARTSSVGFIATASQYSGIITTNPADNTDVTAHILGNTGTQSVTGTSTGWLYGDIVSDPSNPTTTIVLDVDNALYSGRVIGDVTSNNLVANATVDMTNANINFNGAIVSGLVLETTLDQISDVDTTGATNGQALAFDGTEWKPTTISGGGTFDINNALGTSTATTGQILSWTGTAFAWIASGGGSSFNQTLNTTDDVVFNKVTTNDLAFGGTGPVTFTSGNNLAFNATGTITFNGVTYAPEKIIQANTSITVSETGPVPNGEIVFATNGTDSWKINSSGHLLPALDSAFDIGSASFKIRDLYVSTSTIHMGDNKISIEAGKMKYNDDEVLPVGALQTLVASATDFDDFKAKIALL